MYEFGGTYIQPTALGDSWCPLLSKLDDFHRNSKHSSWNAACFLCETLENILGLHYAPEKPRLSSRSCSSLVLWCHEGRNSKTTWWQVAIPGIICSDINIIPCPIRVLNLWKDINTSQLLPGPLCSSFRGPAVGVSSMKNIDLSQAWLLSLLDSEGQLDPPSEFWNDSSAVFKPPAGTSMHHITLLLWCLHDIYRAAP